MKFKKFFKKKWFWVLLLVIIGIGIFLYFRFQKAEIFPEEFWPEEIIPEELRGDRFEPASQIKKPASGTWQNRDFFFETLDEDLESEINPGSCQYKVLSYEISGQEHASGWQQRRCNYLGWVGVGEGKWCRFEGKKACWVFISSRDRAENPHLPAIEKGSVKYYHIDWAGPEVEKVSITEGKAKVRVTDNFKITGCNLYLDGENLGGMLFLVPGCEKECSAFKEIDLKLKPGEHRLWAVCEDAAGNYGRGEEFLIKENLPPEISSCKVTPTQGNLQTDFQFKVEATDPDGDSLTFLWQFGDGQSSSEENPFHKYLTAGIHEPKVKVFDGKGGEDSCSTAWVVVEE